MVEERVYMVFGTDDAGDYELFATDDRQRAETRYQKMLGSHSDVQANWMMQRSDGSDGLH